MRWALFPFISWHHLEQQHTSDCVFRAFTRRILMHTLVLFCVVSVCSFLVFLFPLIPDASFPGKWTIEAGWNGNTKKLPKQYLELPTVLCSRFGLIFRHRPLTRTRCLIVMNGEALFTMPTTKFYGEVVMSSYCFIVSMLITIGSNQHEFWLMVWFGLFICQ